MPADPATRPHAVSAAAEQRLGVARWFAARGYPVHPLAPGAKTPAPNCPDCRTHPHPPTGCPCHARSHRWCHGFHAATTDPEVLGAWWREEPGFGVGVSCGPAGLVVLDVDAHGAPVPERHRLLPGIRIDDRVDLTGLSSGYDTLALLAAHRAQPHPAEDAGTLRVRTPSGGLHIWYRLPLGSPHFRSSSGSGPRVALAWQVDVRASGGYIVAPTTRTAAGVYEALPGARTPAPLPLWLAAELTRTGHACSAPGGAVTAPVRGPVRPSGPAGEGQGAGEAQRILRPLLDAVRACAAAPRGTAFTEKLNRAAFTAGGLAAAGHIPHADCASLLAAAAEAARPHQSRRNRLVIDSALRAGGTRPIHPEGRS
ncbi:bifunctional DNA primase/polymerase [Streptomyces sp. NBC_00249]|uniref:bifunctional DNA primase/polymerase n=1 Tax=Streptomyces sp. NBC_00249 TaxID=2975690 RepID=UPI002258CF49|nr:bifunctional DNA primase/polymerase [Streptomyces sp. NBC_00249]MCX5199239.1 bifunctional DNA primase/polymerase [Streptomyces sp. NBC_00249]